MNANAGTPPVRFLRSLGNLLTAASLYRSDHPARQRAFEALHEDLKVLSETGGPAVFSFLGEEVVHGAEPLRDLEGWPWARRFHETGLQRLEISPGVDRNALEGFLAELAAQVGLGGDSFPPGPHPGIRFGRVAVQGGSPDGEDEEHARGYAPPLRLEEEVEAVQSIHRAAAVTETVSTAEAAAVVRALLVAVRSARELVAPLLEIKSTDHLTTAHSINVSILSMSLAEYFRLPDREIVSIGEAALLHDIGKTRIPVEILKKPGTLTPEERTIVERHSVEGARMLLRSDERNVLATVVAYEHHMHWDGSGGYPTPRMDHRPHRFSRLIQVCDVFDALRTRQPFRPAFTPEDAMEFLRQRAGSEFDPEVVRAFLSMMRQWDPEILPLDGAAEGAEPAGPEDLQHLLQVPRGSFDADKEGELYPA